MVTARTDQPESKNTPVSIRLGELGPRVLERTAIGSALPATVRRDLSRYYEILRDERNRLGLSGAQASAVIDGVAFRGLDKGNSELIWAMVEAYLRDHPDKGLDDAERSAFTERLRKMRTSEALYLVDAIERFRILWGQYSEDYVEDAAGNWNPREQAFYEAGLTHWSPKDQYETDQYLEEQAEEEE